MSFGPAAWMPGSNQVNSGAAIREASVPASTPQYQLRGSTFVRYGTSGGVTCSVSAHAEIAEMPKPCFDCVTGVPAGEDREVGETRAGVEPLGGPLLLVRRVHQVFDVAAEEHDRGDSG